MFSHNTEINHLAALFLFYSLFKIKAIVAKEMLRYTDLLIILKFGHPFSSEEVIIILFIFPYFLFWI